MSRYRVLATSVDVLATYGAECAFESLILRGVEPGANDSAELCAMLHGAEFETEWQDAEREGDLYVPASAEELRKHVEAGRIEAME